MADNRKDLPPVSSPNFLEKVREALSVYLGNRGDPLNRGLTVRDLADAGLVVLTPGYGSGTGVPPISGPGPSANPPYESDLTPPPTPTGFDAVAGITNIQVTCDPQTYTAGHGHSKSRLYGATGASPVFSQATLLEEFNGTVFSHATNPATTWHLWLTWVTVDGVESTVPAGGTNGVVVTTGQDVSTLLTALTGEITASQLHTDLGTRIDLIDTTGTGLVDSLAAAKLRLDAVDTPVTGLIDQVDGVKTRLAAVDTPVAGLIDQLAAAKTRIDAVDTPTTGLLDRMDSAETRLDLVDAPTTGLIDMLAVTDAVAADAAADAASALAQLVTVNTAISDLQGTPDYNGATTYPVTSIVKYMGALYQATAITTGNLPTDTAYWVKIGDYASLGDAVVAISAIVDSTETRVTTVEGQTTSLTSTTNALTATSLQNAAVILAEQTARASADDSLSSRVVGLTAVTGTNTAGLSTEQTARATDTQSFATQVTTLAASTGGNIAGLTAEQTARATDTSTLASQVTTLVAQTGSNRAGLIVEQTARADATGSLAQQITTLSASTANTSSLLAVEQAARATDTSSLATQVTTLTAATGANVAGLTVEQTTRANEASALASQISTVSAAYGSTSALVQAAQTASADADTALSGQVTTLKSTLDTSLAGLVVEQTARATATSALADQIVTIYAGTASGSAAVLSEQSARVTETASIASSLTALAAATGTNVAGVTSESTARTTDTSALATQIITTSAAVGANAALIQSAKETSASATGSLASQLTTLRASSDTNLAGIQLEQAARVTDTSALANQVSTISANTAAGSALLSAEQTARVTDTGSLASNITAIAASTGANLAGITSEQTARTTETSAITARVENLVAVAGDSRAALTIEQSARATAEAALAGQVTSLVAGMGANLAGLVVEQTVRADATASIASQVTTLTASTGSNAAAILAEQTVRADADDALTQTTLNLTSAVGLRTINSRQRAIPTAMTVGDLWVDTGSENLLTYSEQMNLGWGLLNCVITSDQIADPNGVVSAEKLAAAVAGGVSATHYIDKTLNGTYTIGDFYTQSFYVKASEETTVAIYSYYASNGGSGRYTFFNLTSKTVTTSTATSSGIVDVGDGWLRCWQVVAVDTVETRLLSRIRLRNSNYIGDGTSGLYLWGFQLEKGAGVGRYIQTTTAAVSTVGNNKMYMWDGTDWVLSTDQRVADTAASLTVEQQTRASETLALSNQVTALTASTGANASGLSSELTARATDTTALASQLTTLTAFTGASIAGITAGQTVSTTADAALASQVSTVAALTGASVAGIVANQSAATTATSAVASQVTTLQATADGNTAAIALEAQTRADETGALFAEYTVKLDVDGKVSGYGLASSATSSTFEIRADKFAIAAPTGSDAGVVPFAVLTSPTTIGGIDVPAGTYIDSAFIKNGTITTAQIGNATIDTAQITGLLTASQISAGTIDVGEYIQSADYVSSGGTTGWYISGDGDIVANNATVRGEFIAQGPTTGDYARMYYGNVEIYRQVPSVGSVLYKALSRMESGVCSNNVLVTIPGYFKAQPKVIVSPNSMQLFSVAYAGQDQTINCTASAPVETSAGSMVWQFTPTANLVLASGSLTTVINQTSGATSADTWTSSLYVTAANTSAITPAVTIASKRGNGASSYFYRTIRWRVEYRVNGSTGAYTNGAWNTVALGADPNASITLYGWQSLGSANTWQFRIYAEAYDTSTATFTGTAAYDYTTATVTHSAMANSSLYATVGGASDTVSYTNSYTPTGGWELSSPPYSSAYTYTYTVTAGDSFGNNYGQARVTDPNGTARQVSGYGVTESGSNIAKVYSGNTLSFPRYAQQNSGSMVYTYANLTINSFVTTVYLRKLIPNSTTPANTYTFSSYSSTLSTATVLATGTLNWVAIGE